MKISKKLKKEVINYLIKNEYGSFEGISKKKKSLGFFFGYNTNLFEREGVAILLLGTEYEGDGDNLEPDGKRLNDCCSTIDYLEDLEDWVVNLIYEVVQAGAVVLTLELDIETNYKRVGGLIRRLQRERKNIQNFDQKLAAVWEKLELDKYYQITNNFKCFKKNDDEDYVVLE